jgi:hypothetical protein
MVLKSTGGGQVFCNPPYSQIELWIKKAIEQTPNCESITLLLPNWTDRKWFALIENYKIKFLPGRLRFTDPVTGLSPYNPRFGSMLVYLKENHDT